MYTQHFLLRQYLLSGPWRYGRRKKGIDFSSANVYGHFEQLLYEINNEIKNVFCFYKCNNCMSNIDEQLAGRPIQLITYARH